MRFTISARGKAGDIPVLGFLARNFPQIAVADIDSIFGFVERCTLYGGRPYTQPELSERDVHELSYARIGLRLPLTNHYVTEQEYEDAAPFLQKYHREGNAVIVTDDDLARWLRRDFPAYRIEASVIKNLKSIDRISAAFDLYDTLVLPMELNTETDFLATLPNKDRITLFANAGCAFTCPSKTCYVSISKYNKTGEGELVCSQPLKQRELRGMVDFDLRAFEDLGFHRFKLLRARQDGSRTGY